MGGKFDEVHRPIVQLLMSLLKQIWTSLKHNMRDALPLQNLSQETCWPYETVDLDAEFFFICLFFPQVNSNCETFFNNLCYR